jgi:histidinol dehydrogenase
VPHELDQILISRNQVDSSEQMLALRTALINAAIFEPYSENGKLVIDIISEVAIRGDDAVVDFTERFDRVKLTPAQFKIPPEDLARAHKEIDKSLLVSIRQAVENIKKYQLQIFIGNMPAHRECGGGTGIKYTPIKRVGVCVPGASAPLPSTVMMTAVPAQIAGVEEIVVVSPPRYNGSIHPIILAVCHELGITEVYRVGGVQAITALACGTKTIPKVDKIVGPGNQWVQTAKKMVSGIVGIDSIAGPSEVLIIANDKANPAWVAADMLSQAEHAPGGAVVFTDSQKFAESVLSELKRQAVQLDRANETIDCLKKFGKIVAFKTIDEAVSWANYFAAEHLQIQCGDESKAIAEKIENAGAIFIGDYSPVAVGDYWAGPSHTLPTGMTAKFFSALSANDFIKSTSIIEYDEEKLAASADDIIRLAEVEGLDAHAKSIKIRQKKILNSNL